jgi:type IV pilus assembly protein PilE
VLEFVGAVHQGHGKMNNLYGYRNIQAGFTLIELMIVVVVIAILASVGIPSYTGYVADARRQGAVKEVLTIASRQEQHFMDNKTYATSLVDLGYAAATIGTDANGARVAAADSSALYNFTISATTATTSGVVTTFIVSAVPKAAQSSRDTECGTLTLTEAGVKTAHGVINSECW